jgi:hypothetical protein
VRVDRHRCCKWQESREDERPRATHRACDGRGIRVEDELRQEERCDDPPADVDRNAKTPSGFFHGGRDRDSVTLDARHR